MRNPGVVVAALLGTLTLAGLGGCSSGGDGDGSGVAFENPIEVVSQNGVLSTTITMQPAVQTIAEQQVTFPALYNGVYTPATLRVQPGDRVRLQFNNFAVEPTNLHYHGLAVTPQSNGDNVFLVFDPGDSWTYDFEIPASHPQGLFWYHPHLDPYLNTQLASGAAGALIIGDILAPFPQLAGIPERVMLLKDLKTDDDDFPVVNPDPAGPTTRTINGLFQPDITMRPGQVELWRIGDFSSNIFYKLTLEGQPFHIIAIDGNLQNQVVTTDTLTIPPGSRIEALVYGPPAGSYRLMAEDFNTGPGGDAYPGQQMATVISTGDAADQIPLPSNFPPVRDLRTAPIAKRRTIVFDDTPNPDEFVINGKPFTANCIDHLITLGDTEEWTIQNASDEAHVFHIHQLDFQVTEIDGEPKPFTGHQDIVTLPPAGDDGPSVVKAIIPFDDPVILGKFVFHCHIIQHEVFGMMASVVVQEPGAPPPDLPLCQLSPEP